MSPQSFRQELDLGIRTLARSLKRKVGFIRKEIAAYGNHAVSSQFDWGKKKLGKGNSMPNRETLDQVIEAMFNLDKHEELSEPWLKTLIEQAGLYTEDSQKVIQRYFGHGKNSGSAMPASFEPTFEAPSPVPYFVGRKKTINRIRNLVESNNGRNIVFITGPPGIGKSAIAKQVAKRLKNFFQDGVLWVNGKRNLNIENVL